MENPTNRKQEILFTSHLQEVDDLEKYDRDAPLSDSEKNKEDLIKIAEAIVNKIKQSDKKVVLFITSPRIRAKETARLVAEEIKNKLNENIKIRFVVDENLKSTEQGEFILPEGYTSGSFFEGLSMASDIFIRESITNADNNLNYNFGDPVIQPDGSYKYPELAKYFKSSGETYAQSLIRIFNSVISMSKKVDKLDLSTEVVLISHGFNFHILRGLSILAEQLKNNEISIKLGNVVNKIWEIYQQNTTDFKQLSYVPLDITNLGDEELIDFLSKEVEFLKTQ